MAHMKRYRLRGVAPDVPTKAVMAELGPGFEVVQRVLEGDILQVRAEPAAVRELRKRAGVMPLWTGALGEWEVEPRRPVSDIVLVHVVYEWDAARLACARRAWEVLREIGFPVDAVKRVFLQQDQKNAKLTAVRTDIIFAHMTSIDAARDCLGWRWDAEWSAVARGHIHVHQLGKTCFNTGGRTNALTVEGGVPVKSYRCKQAGQCQACLGIQLRVFTAANAINEDPPALAGLAPELTLAGALPLFHSPTPLDIAQMVDVSLGMPVGAGPGMYDAVGGLPVGDAVGLMLQAPAPPMPPADSPYMDYWCKRALLAEQTLTQMATQAHAATVLQALSLSGLAAGGEVEVPPLGSASSSGGYESTLDGSEPPAAKRRKLARSTAAEGAARDKHAQTLEAGAFAQAEDPDDARLLRTL